MKPQWLAWARNLMPKLDVVNAFVACAFQLSLGVAAVLYFTWYKNLPSPDEV
jgi:hypothetical protein